MTNLETLTDLMKGHKAAEIVCAVRGIVVRRLVVCDDTLEIDASGAWGREEFAAPLDTAISFRPWFMDRGDVVLTTNGQTIKLCTEHDLIRYEDGTTAWLSSEHDRCLVLEPARVVETVQL